MDRQPCCNSFVPPLRGTRMGEGIEVRIDGCGCLLLLVGIAVIVAVLR